MSDELKKYIEYLLEYFKEQQSGEIDELSRPRTFEEIYGYTSVESSLIEMLVDTYYKK